MSAKFQMSPLKVQRQISQAECFADPKQYSGTASPREQRNKAVAQKSVNKRRWWAENRGTVQVGNASAGLSMLASYLSQFGSWRSPCPEAFVAVSGAPRRLVGDQVNSACVRLNIVAHNAWQWCCKTTFTVHTAEPEMYVERSTPAQCHNPAYKLWWQSKHEQSHNNIQ